MPTPSFNIVSPSIMEVRAAGLCHGSRTLTVLHYAFTWSGGAIDGWPAYDAMHAAMIGGFRPIWDDYLACCGTDFQFQFIDYQWVWPTRFIFKRNTSVLGEAGTGPSDSLPLANSAGIIRRGTAASRHGRGTIKMPAVPTDFVTVDSLTAPALAAYGILADDLTQTIPVTVGATVTSAAPNLFNRANPGDSQAVSGWDVRTALGTERRRLPGRGI